MGLTVRTQRKIADLLKCVCSINQAVVRQRLPRLSKGYEMSSSVVRVRLADARIGLMTC